MEKGQKRMLHIKIWQNESFALMSPLARLLYIGLVILADDDGRLKGNSILLKSQVFPFNEKMTLDEFKLLLKEVLKSKLVDIYRIKNDFFIAHPNWSRYQYIRKDLYKPSIYPENPLRVRDGDVTEKIPKKRKEKKREEKEENTTTYLSKIPEEDIKEFYERFDVSKKMITDKAEKFLLYCKSNAKWYADPKSALLNAMLKDFQIRQPKQSVTITGPEDTGPRIKLTKEFKDSINKIIGDKQIK